MRHLCENGRKVTALKSSPRCGGVSGDRHKLVASQWQRWRKPVESENLSYLRGAQNGATAPRHGEVQDEVAWVSGRIPTACLSGDVFWARPTGRRPCRQLRRRWREYVFWLPGNILSAPGRTGWSGWGEGILGFPIFNMLLLWPKTRKVEENECMDGWWEGGMIFFPLMPHFSFTQSLFRTSQITITLLLLSN